MHDSAFPSSALDKYKQQVIFRLRSRVTYSCTHAYTHSWEVIRQHLSFNPHRYICMPKGHSPGECFPEVADLPPCPPGLPVALRCVGEPLQPLLSPVSCIFFSLHATFPIPGDHWSLQPFLPILSSDHPLLDLAFPCRYGSFPPGVSSGSKGKGGFSNRESNGQKGWGRGRDPP